MKKVFMLLMALSVITLYSCQTDNQQEIEPGKNTVQFLLNFSDEIEMYKLKAGRVVNTDDFLISVVDQDTNLIIENSSLASISNGIYLEEGTYTAYALYGDTTQVFGWDEPVYSGNVSFDVTANTVTKVQLSVALTNTKVEVIYSDFLVDVYPDISVEICSRETDHCASFAVDSTKIGYYAQTEQLLVHVKPTPDVIHTHEISGVQPNMHYRLTFSAKNQGADFDITIEEEDLIEIEYNVPIDPGVELPDGNEGNIEGKTFEGNLNLVSQAAIDNLAEQQFVIINGNLTLNGTSLSTAGLDDLQKVTGNLTIAGSGNLEGLLNLAEVGGNLSFSGSHSFTPLNTLKKVGGSVTINATTPSYDCTGLENLEEISGNLSITFNTNFRSLKGLEKLTTIHGELYIIPFTRSSATNSGYDGFDRNLSELKSIKTIGQLTIGAKTFSTNANLYSLQILSLNGLENLVNMGGFTVTHPRRQWASNGIAYITNYIYDYCAVPVELWQIMPLANYTNNTHGYNPPLSTLRQGICRQ